MPQLYHDDGDLDGVSNVVVVGANGSHDPAGPMPEISQLSMPRFQANPRRTGGASPGGAHMQQNGIPLNGFAMLQHNGVLPMNLPHPAAWNDGSGVENKFDKEAQPIFADQIGQRGYPAVQLQTDQLRSGHGSSTDQRSHNDESSGHSGGSGEGSGNSQETVNQSQAYQNAAAEDVSFQQANALLSAANGDPAMLSVLHAFAGILHNADGPNMNAMSAQQLHAVASSMMMQNGNPKPGTPNPWPDAQSPQRGPIAGMPGVPDWAGAQHDGSGVLRAVDNDKVMKLSSLVGKNMSEKQYPHYRDAEGKQDYQDPRQPRQPASHKRYGPDMWCVELNRTIVHAMQARKYDTLIRTLPEALPRMDGVNL